MATFITNNGVDFRGSAKKPGSQGVYADVPLHAGLVCVDAPGGLNMESQKRLFDLVLSDLEQGGALTNQVLQVTLSPDGSVELARYGMPAYSNPYPIRRGRQTRKNGLAELRQFRTGVFTHLGVGSERGGLFEMEFSIRLVVELAVGQAQVEMDRGVIGVGLSADSSRSRASSYSSLW